MVNFVEEHFAAARKILEYHYHLVLLKVRTLFSTDVNKEYLGIFKKSFRKQFSIRIISNSQIFFSIDGYCEKNYKKKMNSFDD